MSSLYFFVVLTLIFKVSCRKTSLSFVIDNTNSMSDDIIQVKKLVESIMDIVLEEKSNQISNLLLITFNDPENSSVAVNTSNRMDITRALKTLRVDGGTDCPELALSGVKLALESSLPGSYIYVLTDASAKDYYMNEEIQQLCQTKQSQIVFIIALTGDCGYPDGHGFQVYYNITAASSGMAIRVPKDNVATVVKKFVEEDIKGNKIGLAAQLTPANVRTQVSFTIDELTNYAIVAAAGTDVHLSHIKGASLRKETIIWTKYAKAIKFVGTKPGEYMVSVKSDSVTSVVVTGRTDFYFRYGFSKRKPISLNDTELQPFSDTKTRLSLLVTDENFSAEIKSAQILDMMENVITEFPLQELSLNFYTTDLFLVPSNMFKVAMIGEVIQTRSPVRRIAKIPIEPQTPQPEAPKVKGVEKQEVRLGAPISIICNVIQGVPYPKISWQFKPKNSEQFTDMNYTADVWHNPRATSEHSGSYKCTATNSRGTDEHVVQLTVKEPARNISEGIELRIPCDTFSYPKPAVKWEVNGSPITPGTKYDIDDGELIIKNPTRSDNNNNYTCTASKTFQAYVDDTPMDYGILRDVNILQGHALKLTCSLPRVGLSSVKWSTDEEVIAFDQADIIIPNAQPGDDENYTCQVSDVNGSAKETFLVDVGYPPSFKFTQDIEVVWNPGTEHMLRCDVIAKPPAKVEWTVNGNPLSERSMQLSVSRWGRYKCNVSNIHGSVQRDFDVRSTRRNT